MIVPHYEFKPYEVMCEGGEVVSILARDESHAIALLSSVESLVGLYPITE